MSKQDFMKLQSCVLRVNINCACDGCKQKVKQMLHKIDGVYTTSIDVEQGKVTVTGNADPSMLIKKLSKSGKHAELWGGGGSQKNGSNSHNQFKKNNNENQFKNINKMENFIQNGEDNNKSRKGGKDQKPQQQMQQQNKGLTEDNKKSGKFNLHSNRNFVDDYDDDNHYQHHQQQGMSVMGSGMMNDHGKSGGNSKKGVGVSFELPIQVKGMGGKSEGKDNKGGKNGKDKKRGNKKQGGVGGGKSGNGFLGLGKSGRQKSKSTSMDIGDGDDAKSISFTFDKKGGKKNGGGGNVSDTQDKKRGKHGGVNWENKKEARKNGGQMMMNKKQNGMNRQGEVCKNMSEMGNFPMGQRGNYPMAQMGNFSTNEMDDIPMGNYPAVQGMMNNNGYFQGNNPYNQQYMMINEQRGSGPGMYHPIMYGQQQPTVSYGSADNITHLFNDENTSSCSIM